MAKLCKWNWRYSTYKWKLSENKIRSPRKCVGRCPHSYPFAVSQVIKSPAPCLPFLYTYPIKVLFLYFVDREWKGILLHRFAFKTVNSCIYQVPFGGLVLLDKKTLSTSLKIKNKIFIFPCICPRFSFTLRAGYHMHYMGGFLIKCPWLSGNLSQAMAPPFCIQFPAQLHNN